MSKFFDKLIEDFMLPLLGVSCICAAITCAVAIAYKVLVWGFTS